MKLLAQREGLALPMTIATAIHPKDTLVAITGDKTVDKAGANAHVAGRISVPSKSIGGIGTVEFRYKEYVECKIGSSAIAAGALVKLQAVDGTTGENVAIAWVSGTDAIERLWAICIKGASANGVAEFLTF